VRGFVQGVGALLVLVVLQDAFTTVLFPASGHGVLRRPLSRWTWGCFRGVARRLPGDRRRTFLTYSGPVQVVVSLGARIVLLVVGWAMVFQPALGSAITVTGDPQARSWAVAVHYSGYALTTLGLGDVTAHTALLLAGQARDGELPGVRDELGAMAEFVQRALETHASYPVLRYFHQRRTCYALPRVLLLALDSVGLLRSALDRERYRALVGSPSVAALDSAAHQLLAELVPRSHLRPPTEEEQRCWRERLHRAAGQLADAGLGVRRDLDAAAEDYVGQRRGWGHQLRALADAMAYDWGEVEPARRP
jgi:hypothetical protein